jgi:hypothetical protein
MSSMSRYPLCPRGRFARAWHLAAIALVAAAFGASASAAAAGQSTAGEVNIVRQGAPPAKIPANTHYYKTIQAAVNASKSGAYVLIEPGVYYEEVKVTSAHSGIWIRGLNRNTVIVDGQHKVGNGIEIYKANNVWVENLTVRNFEFGASCPDEECGNEIWWNGGAESGKIGAHGWYGSYLTAYGTGLYGGYGIFTNNETEGSWENIYASGMADSGIYIGACQECNARVSGATMENDALGYSGSNAGGKLVIENSKFSNNLVGIAPNSENPGDPPPPQDGECGRPNIENPNPTPIITTTNIKRCTIFRKNLVTENSNLTVPTNGSTEIAPWGVGIELPGDYADLVEGNIITNNPNDGVLGFEYPNPYPFSGVLAPDILYFQVAGNRISSNVFGKNGTNPNWSATGFSGDASLLSSYAFLVGGPEESHSTNNCLSGNLFTDGTYPTKIEGTWGCQNKTTPVPGGGVPAAEYLLGLIGEAAALRTPVAQKAPPAQPTMPNPCEGVPKNPLCS